MRLLLVLILMGLSTTAFSQTAKLQINEALLKLKIQTVLISEGETVAPLSIPQIDLSKVKMKKGLINEFIYSSFAVIPHEIKIIGRENGRGPMYFFIALEGLHIVLPVLGAVTGHPELAALVVGPDTIPLVALMVSMRRFSERRKEIKQYGSKKTRRQEIAETEEGLKAIGIKKIKTDTIILKPDGSFSVISKKNRKSFNDQISMKRLRSELKETGIWSEDLSSISKDVRWKKDEKIFLIFNQLGQTEFESVSPRVKNELEDWLLETAKIDQFSKLKDQYAKLPKSDLHASTLYRAFDEVLLPYWTENMSEKGFKKYKCLLKRAAFLRARADLADDRFWNSEDSELLEASFKKCHIF